MREGMERGRFLIGSEHIEVATYGRLSSDLEPIYTALPLLTS